MCSATEKCTQPKGNHQLHAENLYANIPYKLQLYHKHNKYLCVQLDTCTDVNLMPESVTSSYLMILKHQNW